jgi:hypothetical protein
MRAWLTAPMIRSNFSSSCGTFSVSGGPTGPATMADFGGFLRISLTWMIVFEPCVKVVPGTMTTLVWYSLSKMICVSPIRIVSPLTRSIWPLTRRSLRYVPFLLPRSWMAKPFSVGTMSAWQPEL